MGAPVSDAEPTEETHRPPWALEAMPVRSNLMRDLAIGMTQQELGPKYRVTQQAVSKFAHRHADQIAAIAADLDNEFAGLWVASRARRVEAYQQDIDALGRYIEAAVDEGMELDTKLIRTKQAALRAVAEELGQLRTVIDHTATVRYELAGVDPKDLT